MRLQILILLILGLNIYPQNSEKEFEISEYINGNLYRETVKNITVDDEIDIHFMKKYFFIPYYIPQKFIDSSYKNDTIVIWNSENEKRNYNNNWTNTYVYDSKSRIIEYEYSGCLACSEFPYKYKVFYDENNRVIELKNMISSKQRIQFRYNSNGEIQELSLLSSDNKLITKIVLKS